MKQEFTVSAYVRAAFNKPGERRDMKVLLVKHHKFNLYVPVGGRIEKGETPYQAVQRELKEETGFVASYPIARPELSMGQPPGLIGYEEHDAGQDRWHMNFSFVADVETTGLIPHCEEFSDPAWFRADEVPESSPDNVKELVRRALQAPWVRNCGDCGAKPGEEHDDGCDMEHCSVCGVQKIQCEKHDKEHDKKKARWTGYSDGELECRKRGWFAVCVGPGNGPIYHKTVRPNYEKKCREAGITPVWTEDHQSWMPCEESYPGASPDLNRWAVFEQTGKDLMYPKEMPIHELIRRK